MATTPYSRRVWPVMDGQFPAIKQQCTDFARGRINKTAAFASLPELQGGVALRDNAENLVMTAYEAVRAERHPLPDGRDLFDHMKSVMNSLLANMKTSADNRRRSKGGLDEERIVIGQQVEAGGGKRVSRQEDIENRNAQRQRMKDLLPLSMQFERALIDATDGISTQDIGALAKRLDATKDQVVQGFDRIRAVYAEKFPAKVAAIKALANEAVRPTSVETPKGGAPP